MVELAHHVPGRLRVRIAGLKHDASAAAALRVALLEIDGVTFVSVNGVTGSTVITYDRDSLDPAVLWAAMEHLGHAGGREPAGLAMHAPVSSPLADKLAAAAADHIAKAAVDYALRRLVGGPAAMLVGALI